MTTHDTLQIGPRTTIRRGDWFRATAGPYWSGRDSQGQLVRQRMTEPGPYKFLRLVSYRRKRWIEAINARGQCCILMLTSYRSQIDGLVGRPYRITARPSRRNATEPAATGPVGRPDGPNPPRRAASPTSSESKHSFTRTRRADMARNPTTLADTLRDAIEAHGTLYAVAKGSGVPYPTLHSFFSGDADVRLSTVQKLADYLKLELAPKTTKGRK